MGLFQQIQGLPWHPLIVHVVVILVPVSALGLLAILAIPKWRRPGQWFVLAGLIIGGVGTYIAKLSGDSLSAAVGLPVFHAEWGNNMVVLVVVLVVVTAAWILLEHLGGQRILERTTAVIAAILSVGALGMTYVVGHSGAESVWAGTYEEAKQPPSTVRLGTITMSEVSANNTPEACWTVVDDAVYDLTGFIARHPAGAGAIVDMCGKDASGSFNGAHEGQGEPEQWLAVFRIGTLS
jgi:hypothetical protein